MARLVAGLPVDETDWTSEHRALWLLSQMLEYHRREDKSSWWEYFRHCGLSDDELLEDKNALGGLTYVGPVGQVKQSIVHRYSFPSRTTQLIVQMRFMIPRTKTGCRHGPFDRRP